MYKILRCTNYCLLKSRLYATEYTRSKLKYCYKDDDHNPDSLYGRVYFKIKFKNSDIEINIGKNNCITYIRSDCL